MLVEIDMDGVTLDIYGPLESAVRVKFPDFSMSQVKTWAMNELEEEVRNEIMRLFFDRDFMGSLQMYAEAEEAMRLMKQSGHTLMINTSVCGNGNMNVRLRQLDVIAEHTDFVQVSSFPSKPMLQNADVTIDDHIGNMHKSKTPVKILITQNHNSHLELMHVKDADNSDLRGPLFLRAETLMQAAKFISCSSM